MKIQYILLLLLGFSDSLVAQSKSNYFFYKVQDTDKSLWRICTHFSVDISIVKQLSKKQTNAIRVGELLKMPTTNLIVHLVQRNDKSLWRISQKYGVNYKKLVAYNRKSDAVIRLGEYLVFPKSWLTKIPLKTSSPTEKKITYSKIFFYREKTYKVYVVAKINRISNIDLILYHRRNGYWELLSRKKNIEATHSIHYLKKEKVLRDLDKDGFIDFRFLDKKNRSYQQYKIDFKNEILKQF